MKTIAEDVVVVKRKPAKQSGYIWIVSYDHDWGMRGNRRNSEWYFAKEPTEKQIRARIPGYNSSALSILKLRVGKERRMSAGRD